MAPMPIAPANGVELCYETFGDPAAPPLLLVMGLGAQMTLWHEDFCRLLADGGHFVIRFDNRDCGLSTKIDAPLDLTAVVGAVLAGGEMPPVPYLLSDLAADAVGLLDHLDLASTHVVGASMGGMIAQTMAIEHPARCRSLTSIMSSTGEPAFMEADPEATAVLLTPPPSDRDAYLEQSVTATRVIGGKRYFDAEEARRSAAVSFDRGLCPEGTTRQMAAIFASGDRAESLRSLTVPTLVVHGRDDTLILPPAGPRTAELVPNADLLLLGDMGHDLPRPLWPLITGAILAHAARADAG